MTASPAVLAAFEAWKLAELASHYAAPCPDEIMDHLVGLQSDAFDALHAMPAANADDMLLKLFPILIREFEPRLGQAPMKLGPPRSYKYEDDFLNRLEAQLKSASPVIAEAMAAPHKDARENAA